MTLHITENGRDIIYLRPVTPMDLLELKCREFLVPYGISFEEIRKGRSKKAVSEARWALMHFLREELGLSWARVGRLLNKDHTSVIYGCAKHHEKLTGETRAILARRLS